jgi:hypothetical protein
MKKPSIEVFVVGILLVLALGVSIQTLGVRGQDSGSSDSWLIEEDCVSWSGADGDIKVCPHTISGSGWVEFEVTSYLPNTDLQSLGFGITDGLSISRMQMLQNVNHPNVVSNCTTSTVEILNNGTPEFEDQTVCNSYLADGYYDDWVDVGELSNKEYEGKMWSSGTAVWDSGETRKGRVWIDVEPRSGKNKYEVILKQSSDTLAAAFSSDTYVLLDPWVDSPPTVFNETFDDGAFLNGTWGNLNISSGFLIMNMTGANETNVMLNASVVQGQNCWNSSADPGYSDSNYNCGNLIDTPGNPFAVGDIWAASDTSAPQWVAYELADYFWLYNFSYDKGFDTQNGRNPANWSVQVPSGGVARANPNGPGADNSTDWTFMQFNSSNSAGDAPSKGGLVFGPARAKWFRFHIANQNAPGNQIYLETIQAYKSTFNTSGQKLSILLNDTITVDKINATCVNGTGTEQGVNINITVMDKDYNNEQTIQCNNNNVDGFENDITDITGLIYRVNFSADHSGLTPELDYLTLRVTEVAAAASATEAEGDIAIEAGINSSISSATKYGEQQVYVRNLSNNQTLSAFDWVASSGSQRWLFNYITAGESYSYAPNLTTAVYVLEITEKTSVEITDEVSSLINATT